ncbi:MAG: hypothetical protein H6686_10340 [Fibrobacteria bacterium]|nr:hypothetical protein [Fibrobacteria bacterium]
MTSRLTYALAALLALGCQDRAPVPAQPESSADSGPNTPEKAGLAFRLSNSSLELMNPGDSVVARLDYLDGTSREVRSTVGGMMADAMDRMRVDGVPKNSCRIEVRVVRDNGQTVRVVVQIGVEDGAEVEDRVLIDPTVVETGDLVLKPWKDAWIGPENTNSGLGSELRLWEGGSLGLLDFGDLVQAVGARKVARAELVLHGWKGVIGIGDSTTDLSLELGTIPRDWEEGKGDWYWFDGRGQNRFENAYALWPEFLPPVNAVNPSVPFGVRWAEAANLREGFVPVVRFTPELPDGPLGKFPRASETAEVRLDATSIVHDILARRQNVGLALRRATSSLGPRESIAFYSKDHAPSVSPSLVIHFEE